MPTISVDKDEFYRQLGKTYTVEEFDELLFQYGLELDEDTSQSAPNELPHKLKIEVPANRYDLLCFEGLVRALRVYLEWEQRPQFKTLPWSPDTGRTVHVAKEVEQIRPYFAGAILRNLKFDKHRYESFIDLQDKLHGNLARKRTLVAIGTHDLDKVAPGEIRYEGQAPKDINFVPLNKDQAYDGHTMMEVLEGDRHLKPYLPIIRDSPVYPIIYDSTRQVLSMPPVINSDHTKISLDTTNVFIDTTATDQTKLDIVINMIVTMFSAYCSEPFTVEPVKVVYESSGNSVLTPDLSPRDMPVASKYINSVTDFNLSPDQICKLFERMGNAATPVSPDSNEKDILVRLQPTRPDILHPCDLVEDAAIAYGFDNLKKSFPTTMTVAQPFPINKLSDLVRRECAMSGFVEALPLILCSHDESFDWLNRKDDGKTAITLENPKTLEYQIVRTTLLPGLLKTVRENRNHALPLKLFEVSDVAVKDDTMERKARNIRRVASVFVGRRAGFEIVHGLLDRLMLLLGIKRLANAEKDEGQTGYYIKGVDHPTFFPDRSAKIFFRPLPKNAHPQPTHLVDLTYESSDVAEADRRQEQPTSQQAPKVAAQQAGHAVKQAVKETVEGASARDVEIGSLGILHPDVLKHFEIDTFACSALEFDLEPFL